MLSSVQYHRPQVPQPLPKIDNREVYFENLAFNKSPFCRLNKSIYDTFKRYHCSLNDRHYLTAFNLIFRLLHRHKQSNVKKNFQILERLATTSGNLGRRESRKTRIYVTRMLCQIWRNSEQKKG